MQITGLIKQFGTTNAAKLSDRLIGSRVYFQNGTAATIVEFTYPESDPYRMHIICEGQATSAYSPERGNYTFNPTYTLPINRIKKIVEA